MYSDLLNDWQKLWRKCCAALATSLPAELQAHTAYFAKDEFDEFFFQFVCCEGDTLLSFLLTRSSKYLRRPLDEAEGTLDEEEEEEMEDTLDEDEEEAEEVR